MCEKHTNPKPPELLDAGPSTDSNATGRDDGVDVTLIRWMLMLTPKQRLAVLQAAAASLIKLRDARVHT